MSAQVSHSLQSNRTGQALLDDVVSLFTDLVIANGATIPMIQTAMTKAIANAVESEATTSFTELGEVLRDCMEVMCTWRRDVELVDHEGKPAPLEKFGGTQSFANLCRKSGCKHESSDILQALLEFGAVSIRADGKIVSETPTFLLGRASAGGRLATDGLLKQLEGFLKVIHGNVRSVRGQGKPKFERACTVAIAQELEPIFERHLRARGQEFVDSIDEWLERHAKFESTSGRYVELGAGAYFIDLGPHQPRARTY
jgi:hypothetical protein